jgi:hypothetical protein
MSQPYIRIYQSLPFIIKYFVRFPKLSKNLVFIAAQNHFTWARKPQVKNFAHFNVMIVSLLLKCVERSLNNYPCQI